MADLHLEHVAVNGVTLHLAEAGPADGRLVILLHGFPEYWAAWLEYIEVLAAAGYHVIAPDQRGYNLSDKPAEVSAYDLDALAADVIGLADHFGCYRFTVIGHDWGGSVGWWIATRHADRLEQLAVLNAPHPLIWSEAIRIHPEQRRRSRYVQFFRLPWLPELLLRQRRFRALVQGISDRARSGALRPEELEPYRAAWSAPGALTAMLNWYRAFLRKELPSSTSCRIASRVLLIWGERDLYCLRDLAEASLRLCDDGRAEYVKNATHLVQHDEPEHCREILLEFLKARARNRGSWQRGCARNDSRPMRTIFGMGLLTFVMGSWMAAVRNFAMRRAGIADPIYAACAWIFLGLRVMHSLVQATINRVQFRAALFGLSWVPLAVMIVRPIITL